MSRKSIMIVAATCIVLAAAWYFFLWGPSNKSYAATKTKLSGLVTQRNSLSAQVANLKKANVPKLESNVAVLNGAIPATPELDKFFHQIQDAASASGVQLNAVAPAQPSAPTSVKGGAPPIGASEIKVAVTSSGTYAQTTKFIDSLDASQRLVVIDGINISTDPANAGSLNSQLTMRVFSTQKVAAAASPAAAPAVGAK